MLNPGQKVIVKKTGEIGEITEFACRSNLVTSKMAPTVYFLNNNWDKEYLANEIHPLKFDVGDYARGRRVGKKNWSHPQKVRKIEWCALLERVEYFLDSIECYREDYLEKVERPEISVKEFREWIKNKEKEQMQECDFKKQISDLLSEIDKLIGHKAKFKYPDLVVGKKYNLSNGINNPYEFLRYEGNCYKFKDRNGESWWRWLDKREDCFNPLDECCWPGEITEYVEKPYSKEFWVCYDPNDTGCSQFDEIVNLCTDDELYETYDDAKNAAKQNRNCIEIKKFRIEEVV